MSDIQHINLKLDIHTVALDVEREKEQTYREAPVFGSLPFVGVGRGQVFGERQRRYRGRRGRAVGGRAMEGGAAKSLEPVKQKLSELNNRINEALEPTTILNNHKQ